MNEARAYLEYALRTYRESGNKPMQADALCHLAILFHLRGESRNTLESSQEATDLARQFGDPFRQAVALTCLGNAQLGLGNLEQARGEFQAALEMHEKLGQRTTALTPRAGIVQVALKSGEPQARTAVRDLVECIHEHLRLDASGFSPTLGIIALYNPFSLYLTCAQFFQAENDPRANTVLNHAHRRLRAHADKISDGELRMSFLEHIPTHRTLNRMWKKVEKE
jgi:tetratricopeptide (TPR) repeat protein